MLKFSSQTLSVQQPVIADMIAEVGGVSVMSLLWRLIRLKNQGQDRNSQKHKSAASSRV